ncbi:hypothetical protein [Paraburkholderia heleia]|uniref:hypothetical protein n=1 Tax=Paraburkholderia heleia TaxID=634127 RepID=UPI0031E3A297
MGGLIEFGRSRTRESSLIRARILTGDVGDGQLENQWPASSRNPLSKALGENGGQRIKVQFPEYPKSANIDQEPFWSSDSIDEAMVNNVWSEEVTWKLVAWKTMGDKKGGGQGDAWPVARADKVAFLKVLTSQNDPERRVRMYREAVALSTYKHPGIPSLERTSWCTAIPRDRIVRDVLPTTR